MRKLFSSMAITLDGYCAALDGSLDWAPPSFDDDFASDAVNEISTIDIMLFGRVTYEGDCRSTPGPRTISNPIAMNAERPSARYTADS